MFIKDDALFNKNCRDILILMKKIRASAKIISNILSISIDDTQKYLDMLKKRELIIEFEVQQFIFYELNMSVTEELLVYILQKMGGNDEK